MTDRTNITPTNNILSMSVQSGRRNMTDRTNITPTNNILPMSVQSGRRQTGPTLLPLTTFYQCQYNQEEGA